MAYSVWVFSSTWWAGNLDRWFFPERIDAGEPVFGQGCIIWASLTLGLLTIPVVIVSTEEALRAIPRGMREGSYALGATKFQTLVRVLMPMASPGMMTGFILAMARAAGEVAPLMITGAVKNAPVPFDGSFPFLHLDRQFMHLGFHILDISCKSPNVEATKPMVYVTTLLLLLIVLSLSSVAIYLRNRMQDAFPIANYVRLYLFDAKNDMLKTIDKRPAMKHPPRPVAQKNEEIAAGDRRRFRAIAQKDNPPATVIADPIVRARASCTCTTARRRR